MRRTVLFSCLALTVSGTALAGKKKKGKKKTDTPAPIEAPEPDVPGDDKSKKFSKKLISTPMKYFRPVDQLSYGDLVFKGDNTWHAEGKVTLGFEDDACTESGTWTMEAADEDNAATVDWVVTQTTCIGREVGAQTRALLTIKNDGNYDVKMR